MPSDSKEESWKSQPLGRYGSIRDIADATVYLFSDAGSYVNGHCLVGTYSFAFKPAVFQYLLIFDSGRSFLAYALCLDGRRPQIPRFPAIR